jgi:uncharacterized protein
MSARQEDLNGFIEIKDNPFSKVGVFPYLGAQIDSSLIPDKIYNVYRSEDELSDPECIASFKLLPFTNEHAMLGSSDEGLMPAEKKGVHGTTGEDIYFEFPYLKGNLKVYSETLANLIEDGKEELSIGYRCKYVPENGTYDGKPYEFVQRELRGNHIALVDEGRSGHDVRVLDHFKFTLDSGVLTMRDDDNTSEIQTEMDDDEQQTPAEALKSFAERLTAIEEALKVLSGTQKSESDDANTKDELLDDDNDDDNEDDDDDSYDKKSSMDAKDIKKFLSEISSRDSLANRLSHHIGVFDHAEKTLKEVAQYGVKKLGISCKLGHEQAAIEGYLAAKRANSTATKSIGMDSTFKTSQIDKYISEGAQV